MAFILFLLISTLLLHLAGRLGEKSQYVPIVLFVISWILFVGGQYGVGTDYFSYLEKFSDIDSAEVAFSNEYVFLSIIKLSKDIWNNPQITFFLLSLIFVTFLYILMKESMDKGDWWIYFFIFVTFSTAFNNQFNAIRQYLAIVILSLAFILLLRKKHLPALLFFTIGFGIHKSGIIFIAIALILYLLSRCKISNKILYLLLIVSSLVPLLSSVYFDQIPFLIEQVITLGLGYQRYLQGKADYVMSLSPINIYSKLVFLPFFMTAIYMRKRLVFNDFENKLFSTGIFFYALKLMCLASSITNRLGMSFELLMIFPLVFLLRYLNTKSPTTSFLIFIFFAFLYILKVTISPEREYIYDSIFFQNII
ncbi:EpsG family protein [Porphyromonas endodontalis]|uniref:EpsG family protein n=1 Tax=Porphyromonas endodontalis TaxID=28124 RepID=UPI0028E537A0|nr:EpsG family protein [Porphyromonas endodontalis]